MSEPVKVIEISGLTKAFRVGFWMSRKVEALKGLDLSVAKGEIFGFLGPNGAGKSTTIKTITGLIRPDSGSVSVLSHAPGTREAKRNIGYLPENPAFYDYLTGYELLDHYAALLKMERKSRRKRIEELLEIVGLANAARMHVRRYSKGMAQRIGIAQALLQDPELVILDEPTSGLDPLGRHDVRELMLKLRARGKTVFFSTHIIPDVESVCDRVAFLVGGKLQKLGTVGELLGEKASTIEVIARNVTAETRAALQPQVCSVREVGGAVSFLVTDEAAAEHVVRELWARGAVLQSVQPQRGGLEDLFLREFNGARAAAA